MTDDLVVFAPQQTEVINGNNEPWKILIVDDEDQVHKVTELALSGHLYLGRSLQFIHAYSGKESIKLLKENPDVALIFMDVVMETEYAGLEAVDIIRNEMKNKLVRIILRTGQAGQAPEIRVVTQYDINDYKEKTEMTAVRLFTCVYTGLSQYSHMKALETAVKLADSLIDQIGAMLQDIQNIDTSSKVS